MKKTLSLIFALIMALTFVSCDFSDTPQTDTSSEDIWSLPIQDVEIKDPEPSADRNYTKPQGATAVLVQYPTYPEELKRDYDYEVYVSNGVETIQLPVYDASRHKNSFFAVEDTDSYRRFCEFGFEGEVTISVKVNVKMDNYVIMPTSKGIKSTYKDGVITFKLSNPENIAIRLNDRTNTVLSILAEELETDYPKETDDRLIYFKAGLNNISEHSDVKFSLTPFGEFVVPIGYSVYLEPGALVTAKIETEAGNNNFKIYGRGAFMDSRLDRTPEGELANMVFMDTNSNFTIKDVKFLDAHCYNLCFTRARNAVIKNVKLLSSEISTDGITFWGMESYIPGYNDNILIEGCYIYCNDNVFVLTSANGMTVKDCTIGTRCAIVFPQGQLNDFTMEDCDIFLMGDFIAGRMNMQAEGQIDPTWNIKIKDVRAEDAVQCGSLCWVELQGNGKKDIYLENVSLPNIYNTQVNVPQDKNVSLTLKNVYIKSAPILIKSQLSQNSSDVKIKVEGLPNSAKAGVGTFREKFVQTSYEGEPRITVGEYTVPYDQKGALEVEGYLPADNLMKSISYFEDISEYVKEIDGVRMLPYSFFKDVLNMSVQTSSTGVKLSAYQTNSNLLRNGGFENISHTLINNDYANTTDWTCFNFGELHVENEIIKSGESSLRLASKQKGGDKGLAQFMAPIIQQYGAGTYTFEFYARLRGETDVTPEVYYGLARSSWWIGESNNSIEKGKLTTEWQKFTHTVKITDPDQYGYDHAFFYIGSKADLKPVEFFIDDAAMYFKK